MERQHVPSAIPEGRELGIGTVSGEGSITRWMDCLRDGDELAAHRLWERYFLPLTRLAKRQLPDDYRRAGDEEDVALSALATLFSQMRDGHLDRMSDRDDLWRWLVVVTGNKALGRLRHEQRVKRGGKGARPVNQNLNLIASSMPPPEFEVIVNEEFQRLMDLLKDDVLRQIALWKLDGIGNNEIASRLGCARRTVTRKLNYIRKLWETEGP